VGGEARRRQLLQRLVGDACSPGSGLDTAERVERRREVSWEIMRFGKSKGRDEISSEDVGDMIGVDPSSSENGSGRVVWRVWRINLGNGAEGLVERFRDVEGSIFGFGLRAKSQSFRRFLFVGLDVCDGLTMTKSGRRGLYSGVAVGTALVYIVRRGGALVLAHKTDAFPDGLDTYSEPPLLRLAQTM